MTTIHEIELLRKLASGDISADDLTPNDHTILYRLQNESLARWYYSKDQDKGFWEITNEGRAAIESNAPIVSSEYDHLKDAINAFIEAWEIEYNDKIGYIEIASQYDHTYGQWHINKIFNENEYEGMQRRFVSLLELLKSVRGEQIK